MQSKLKKKKKKLFFPLRPGQQHNNGDFTACGLIHLMVLLMNSIHYKLERQTPNPCVFGFFCGLLTDRYRFLLGDSYVYNSMSLQSVHIFVFFKMSHFDHGYQKSSSKGFHLAFRECDTLLPDSYEYSYC